MQTVNAEPMRLLDYLGISSEMLEKIHRFFLTNARELGIGAAILGGIALFLKGSALIINALVLGSLTTMAGVLIYLRLPRSVQQVILKWSVVLDLGLGVLTYLIFGETATALIAAAIVACSSSALFWYAVKQEEKRQKEEAGGTA